MERTKTVIAAEQRLESLPVTYPETTRRCRGVRVGLGPAAPTQTKPYRALFAQQGHHNESERTSI